MTLYKLPAVVLGLGPTGLATIRALGREKVKVYAIDSDLKQITAITKYCKKIHCKDPTERGLINCLVDLGKKLKQKTPLILTKDTDVILVSKNRELLERYFLFDLPSKKIVDLLMDKKLFTTYANKYKVPYPGTFSAKNIKEIKELKLNFPCIMKPYKRTEIWDLNAPAKAFIIHSNEELIKTYEEVSKWEKEMIIQEWMHGPDSNVYFCLMCCDKNSKPISYFVGRKLRQWPQLTGSTAMAEKCFNKKITKFVAETSLNLYKELGYKGLGSVEYKLDERDGKLKITEPTVGRPNLQNGLAQVNGINLIHLYYCSLTNSPLPKINKNKRPVKWIRELADIKSAYLYWKHKKLSLTKWLKSYSGKKECVIFAKDDPITFINYIFKVPFTILKQKLFKNYTKKRLV